VIVVLVLVLLLGPLLAGAAGGLAVASALSMRDLRRAGLDREPVRGLVSLPVPEPIPVDRPVDAEHPPADFDD
jgi:hypothetical protein